MAALENLIRVGKVSSVDATNKKARVYYPGMKNMVSDWLPVIQWPTMQTDYALSGANKHWHEYWGWMPNVDDKVLVIMEYGFNSSGYILGVIP